MSWFRNLYEGSGHMDTVFRIDKYEGMNTFSINFTNLTKLMESTPARYTHLFECFLEWIDWTPFAICSVRTITGLQETGFFPPKSLTTIFKSLIKTSTSLQRAISLVSFLLVLSETHCNCDVSGSTKMFQFTIMTLTLLLHFAAQECDKL